MRTATIEIGFDDADFNYDEAMNAFLMVRKAGEDRIAKYIGEPKIFKNGITWICKQEIQLTYAASLRMFIKKLFS